MERGPYLAIPVSLVSRRIKVTRLVAFLLVSSISLASLSVAANKQSAGRKPAQTKKATQTNGNEGEIRFRNNCGRCHNPPESLSPREARAVVRHMRVRAMLSAEDEKLILQYLAP